MHKLPVVSDAERRLASRPMTARTGGSQWILT
jgi:hypothetical protein